MEKPRIYWVIVTLVALVLLALNVGVYFISFEGAIEDATWRSYAESALRLFIHFLSSMYASASIRKREPTANYGIFTLGYPSRKAQGGGLSIVPPLAMDVADYTTEFRQFECPADKQKTYLGEEPEAGKVPAVRIIFAKYEKAENDPEEFHLAEASHTDLLWQEMFQKLYPARISDDQPLVGALQRALTIDLKGINLKAPENNTASIPCWVSLQYATDGDPFEIARRTNANDNEAAHDMFEQALNDYIFGFLQRTLGPLSWEIVRKRRDPIDVLVNIACAVFAKEWGISTRNATLTFQPSKTLNKAFESRAVEQASAEGAVAKAEGEKQKLTLEGQGAAAALKEKLTAQGEGLASQMVALKTSGDAVLGLAAAGQVGHVTIVGTPGDVAGLGAALGAGFKAVGNKSQAVQPPNAPEPPQGDQPTTPQQP